MSALYKNTQDGHPMLIFERTGDGKLRLREENLKSILQRDEVQDKPVMIFSIAGAMREGKSFILNFVIRYLKSGMNDYWLHNDSETLDGFSWRGGMDADTMGILMWSEPFIVTTPKEKIVILLMDTQGLFDNVSNMDSVKTIFSISVLLSSFQVYNMMKYIKDDTMQYFQTFFEYANLVKATGDKYLLQRLMFLIRDWPSPRTHKYGAEGGQGYLERYFEQKTDFSQSNWDLKGVSEKIQCFLMPGPGDKVSETRQGRKEFRGELSDIDERFLQALPELMKTFFAPENIVPKSLNGQILTGPDILSHAKNLDEIFSGESIPKADDIMTTVKATFYAAVKNETMQKFRAEMEQIAEKNRDTVNETQFLELGRSTLQTILHEYEHKPKFDDDHSDTDDEVSSMLNQELILYGIKHKNYMNTQRKECEKFVASEWEALEKNLEKIFYFACFLPEELSAKFQEFVDKNPLSCPPGIKSGQFAELFTDLAKKRKNATKNKILRKNEEKLRLLRVSLREIKQDCGSYARDEMNEKIYQQIWNVEEIVDIKNEILQSAFKKWQLQMEDINGPENICNEAKVSMQHEVKKILKSFEEKNQKRKKEIEQKAILEVEKLKKLYSTKMTEMVHDVWREESLLMFFHYDAMREIRSAFLKKPLNQYLRNVTLRNWDKEALDQLDDIRKVNERFRQRDDERCLEVVTRCKNDATSLITKELGKLYYEDDELEEKKLLITKEIWFMFDSYQPDCAYAIVQKHETSLENYLQTDFECLISKTNKRNKEFALQDIADIELLMETKSRELFNELLSGSGRTHDRLPRVCDMVRKSLEELVDSKAHCSLVKRKCNELIDPMVKENEKNMAFNMKLEEEKLLRDQRELKMKCLCRYREIMDELLKSRRGTMRAHNRACAEISTEFYSEPHYYTILDDLMKRLEEEKKEYEEKERSMKKTDERHRNRIISHFRNFMEAKLGSYSCSKSEFMEIKKQAFEDAESFRKKLNADLQESLIGVLYPELTKFADLCDKRNEEFDKECKEKSKRIIDDLCTHVDENFLRYYKNVHLLHDVVERYKNQFPKDLKGNSDIIALRTTNLHEVLMECKEVMLCKFKKAEEDTRLMRLRYKNFMEDKLGSYSVSETRFDDFEKQGLEDAEKYWQELECTLTPVKGILAPEINRIRQLQHDRNHVFREQCIGEVKRINAELQTHLEENIERYHQNPHMLVGAIMRYEEKFSKDLRGNPEVLSEIKSALHEGLMKIKDSLTSQISRSKR